MKDLLARRAVDPYRVGLVTRRREPKSIGRSSHDVEGSVELVDGGADRRRFRANLSGPGELVWSQGYHEGWQARVDGRPVRPEAVDLAFVGVPLAAGSHEVEFVFDWAAVRNGRLVSMAALILWLVGLAVALRRRREAPLASQLSTAG